MNIQDLANISKPIVFAFINDSDTKVDIRHASNGLTALARHVAAIKEGTHDTRELVADWLKLEFVVLEEFEVDNLHDRLLRVTYWCDKFERDGYKLYRKRSGIIYKASIDFSTRRQGIVVRLKNRNYESFPVGVFDTIEEATEFYNKYYSGPIYKVVYADNTRTKRALLR